jgi:hypothetical protein
VECIPSASIFGSPNMSFPSSGKASAAGFCLMRKKILEGGLRVLITLGHRGASLNLDDIITNGIEHQLADGVNVQFAHDVRAVCLYCAYA